MTEQTMPTNTVKSERSDKYVISRLSYDCLISSTKSFVHNFNLLSDEEKMEFKSLATYVKQLDKCLPSKQSKFMNKSKKVVLPVSAVASVPVTEVAKVVEEKVVEPVQKGNKRTKKVETKEESPTATAVAEVNATSTTVVEPVKEEAKKTAVKKSTQSKSK
jgi:hypothetical protein